MYKPLFISLLMMCSLSTADTNKATSSNNKMAKREPVVSAEFSKLPVISDTIVYLPTANRYIFPLESLLEQNHQYSPNAAPLLNRIVPLAEKAKIVYVYGFTDKSLQGPVAIKTSEEQAQRVADFLWSRGISLDKLVVQGMGFQEPRVSSAANSVEEHYFNSRIEIDLVP
jgi:hypothetical protein